MRSAMTVAADPVYWVLHRLSSVRWSWVVAINRYTAAA